MDTGLPKAFVPMFRIKYKFYCPVCLVNTNLHLFPKHIPNNYKAYYLPFKIDNSYVYIHKGKTSHFKILSIENSEPNDWGY